MAFVKRIESFHVFYSSSQAVFTHESPLYIFFCIGYILNASVNINQCLCYCAQYRKENLQLRLL